MLAGVAAVTAVGALIALSAPQARASGYDLVRAVLLGAGSASGLAIVIYALAWHVVGAAGPDRHARRVARRRNGRRRDRAGDASA
jgi:hypothetical protein